MPKPLKTIAAAESCTGGMLCARLTSQPGSSAFFKLGLVVYSNQAKSVLLKVPSRILREKGAVSPETARQMAAAVRRIAGTDLGISITGIAGPTGAVPGKPVGTVFIGLGTTRRCRVRRFLFKGSRSSIRRQACSAALAILDKAR